MTYAIAFGPVPSRRLGRSLGVNNIPPKHCSYACVYCQVGPTRPLELERRVFERPEVVIAAVAHKVEEARAAGERIDYITFVPDGEPTLDVNLGEEILGLRRLELPIAVITNASLLWLPAVREELARADLVSLKIDTVHPQTWRRVNRPHGALRLADVLDGIRAFAGEYGGELLTETMLVSGVNDQPECLEAVAGFLAEIAPSTAYLAVPTRPPAEPGALPPEEPAVLRAFEILSESLPAVELLIGEEKGPFARTGDAAQDLLAILAVHPMRQAAVDRYLSDAGADVGLVDRLIRDDRIRRVDYRDDVFYVRRYERVREPQPYDSRLGVKMSREELIKGLNEDLAGELGTIIRYNYQAGKLSGPLGVHVREMLREEVADEMGHAAFLTDVIADLGGEPTTTPMEFAKPDSLSGMLELDLEMERADVKRYVAHAELAEKLGEVELKVKLEEIAADEARHGRELGRLLRGLA